MAESNVVELKPRDELSDDDRMVHTRPRGHRCFHRRYSLDTAARKVYCAECDAEVLAFDALEDLTRRLERYVFERQEFERQAKLAGIAMDEAKRIERNAKARVRRAAAKAPACSCDEHLRTIVARRLGAFCTWLWCPVCGGRR